MALTSGTWSMLQNISKNSAVCYDAADRRWLLFTRPCEVFTAHDAESIPGLLNAVEHRVTEGRYYAAGFVAYEAAPAFDAALAARSPVPFPFIWFGIYKRPETITFPRATANGVPDMTWTPSVDDFEYSRSFRSIKEHIHAGDTYQVNYSFRLRAPFRDDPWTLFMRMIHAQGCGYGAFVNAGRWALLSASPELFFTRDGDLLISRPMKGTMPRGLTHAEDYRQAERLRHSEKNRAENIMIVDMVRNDMGRIADRGAVTVTRLFDVEKYLTLWQMTSTVSCRTGAGLTDIFRALFPAASITGAPKVRTMQIIRDHEREPRRIYTGTMGFLAPDGRAQFNVAIRTVLVDREKKTAEYGVGGGLVWDSEKTDEYEECRTKARVLFQPAHEVCLLETMLWTPDKGYCLLDAHLKRLAESSAYFSHSVDIEAVRKGLFDFPRGLPPHPHAVRLMVTRNGEPTLEAHRYTPVRRPYRVRLAKRPVDPSNHFLYHKTTHRRVYEEAMAGAEGCDDVLLWNEKGEITESCIANVIVKIDGRNLTPPVKCGLLPGTYRALLIEKGTVTEEPVTVRDLKRCSDICLVNSVRGMWEVLYLE